MSGQYRQARFKMEENPDNRYIHLHPWEKDGENDQHKYSLVWLHGLGDSAQGFYDIFLDNKIGLVPKTCKVILPTAPERAVSCNNGYVMTSWYDIMSLDRAEISTPEQNEKNYSQEEITDSVSIVTKLLDAEVETLGGDHSKVFIGGFSQGCAISLATFLRYDKGALGGVIGLSGAHCATTDWDNIDLDLKKKTEMFLYHGEHDNMIPCNLAIKSYEVFQT